MALVLITLQDEPDGTVSLGFTSEPIMDEDDEKLTSAQILGMMATHTVISSLREAEAEDDSSRLEG